MSTAKRQPRNQINLVVDDEIRAAIDEIRASSRPLPSLSDAVRQAVVEKRDRVRGASTCATCATCVHWDRDNLPYNDPAIDRQPWRAIVRLCRHPDSKMHPEYEGAEAITTDPDFGCIQHSPATK